MCIYYGPTLEILKLWLQKNESIFFENSEVVLKNLTEVIELYVLCSGATVNQSIEALEAIYH